MTIEGAVRVVAGTVVLATVALSHPKCPLYVSDNLLFITAFVGFMLVQSAFTGICPAAFFLRKLGMKDPAPAPGRGPLASP
jgi:CDP-diglyceride synthetase